MDLDDLDEAEEARDRVEILLDELGDHLTAWEVDFLEGLDPENMTVAQADKLTEIWEQYEGRR